VALRIASIPRSDHRESRIWQVSLFVGLIAWAALLVYAHSSGRIATGRAVVLLAFPILAIGVALKPAWVVLFLAATPMAQIQLAPQRGLALLLLVTLGGQLVIRGSISVGWRSGFLGLILLFAAAFFFRFDLDGTDALVARGFLNSLAFYISLGLVAYNATRVGDLKGRHLVNAILFGVTVSVLLDSLLAYQGGILAADVGASAAGRPVAYLAAVGFSICFARLILRTESEDHYFHPAVHLILASGFVLAMIPGLLRGAWLSALIAFLFISLWAGKKRYWLVIVLALMVMLAAPVARERVVPNEEQAAGFTTGRSDLWSQLWEEIERALPFGNGFGYTFTLTSEDLFGSGVARFTPEGSDAFVYPHNDFLFWMVELGVLGLLGMALFWTQLLRALRQVSRSESANKLYVKILSGVLITGLVAQLVGSVFFFTALAGLVFIVAGFVFGAREAVTAERRR
jgi:O-Antigen ligase